MESVFEFMKKRVEATAISAVRETVATGADAVAELKKRMLEAKK